MRSHEELLKLLRQYEAVGGFNMQSYNNGGYCYCPACQVHMDERRHVQHEDDCVLVQLLLEVEASRKPSAAEPQEPRYCVRIHFRSPSAPCIFARNLPKQQAEEIRLALCRREDLCAVYVEEDMGM